MIKYISIILILTGLMLVKVKAIDEYYINCDPIKFQEILDNYNEDIYIDATLTFNGKTWQDVQIRIRGDGTRVHPKKSLKVKFGEESFLDKIDEFNLNAEYEDKSYIRQYLSSRIMAECGQDCFKTSHIRLYINDKFYGLYLKIEQVDKKFLSSRNYNNDGNLYKTAMQGACLSHWDNVDQVWDKQTNENQGKEDLIELIRRLNYDPDSNYPETTGEIFNYSKMINFIALNIVIANASTYYHNYYVYDDSYDTKKWYIFPWDIDKTLGSWWPNNQYNSNSARPDNPLHERSLLNDQIFNDIKIRIDTICNTVFRYDYLIPVIDSLVNELTPSVIEDSIDNIPDTTAWLNEVEKNRYFIRERYNELLKQFPAYPRAFRVEPTEGTYTGDIKLVWHPCIYDGSDSIKYKLTYSTDYFMIDPARTRTISNISDTTYILKKGDLPEGIYYWSITAFAGSIGVEGYDNFNKFSFKNGTVLHSPITENTILKKEGSPYLAEDHIVVTDNATLTIMNGVELYIFDSTQIDIKGTLKVEGTQSEPVIIKSFSGDTTFNIITVNNGDGNSEIKFADFTDVFIHFLTTSDVLIEDSKFKFNKEIFKYSIHGSGCNFTMRRCSVSGHGTLLPEGIILLATPYSDVEDSYFENIIDPIEYINVNSGLIKNNIIQNSTDDGIDLNGGRNIVISGNKIYNSVDKGISIGNENFGGAKNITIERNIIAGNSMGIGIKDSAEAYVINNTFYNNDYGIKCYEKNPDQGGGFITVKNCIFADSRSKSINVDSKSTATVTYSLSNTDPLYGAGNIKSQPQFEGAESNNFTLKSNSPCINAGDPSSPKDPDGTRADMGAIPFNTGKAEIVFNEINYNSSKDFDAGDWVELYNPGNTDVDISDWYFSDSDDSHKFILPKTTTIRKDSFLVLCRDKSLFTNKFPNVKNFIGNFDFGLDAAGELVRLFNQAGELIDSLTYDDKLPWPEEPDGNGPTLELINPTLDNSKSQNWKASSTAHGTPGEQNSIYSGVEDKDEYKGTMLKVFPNPFDGKAVAEISLPVSAKISLGIYDIRGSLVVSLVDLQLLDKGEYKFDINAIAVPQQVYYCKLESYYPIHFVICIPLVILGND